MIRFSCMYWGQPLSADAPRTVLQESASIKTGDVVLSARSRDGQPDKRIRLRRVTTPDAAQKVLLNRFGLGPERIDVHGAP